MKLRVIELFAGIGAWSKALENLGIDHEVVAAVEFDKKTMDCYNVIHGSNFEASDVTTLDPGTLPNCDIICYSPPCQSFSVAGKNGGVSDPRGTLFWNALNIIEAKKPKYALMENVKNLTGKKHRATFDSMMKSLEDIGYTNHWKVLNAKDYGTPENRERVFVVSVRNDVEQSFAFPEPFDNGVRLRDVRESEVDEKFYIDDAKCAKLLEGLKGKLGDPQVLRPQRTDYGKAIRKQYEAGEIQESRHNMTELVPRTDGISNTLTTVLKDNYLCVPMSAVDRHRVLQIGNIVDTGNFENPQRGRIYSMDGISPSLNTCGGGGLEPKVFMGNHRIRKLTPKECLRLQCFSDEDHAALVSAGISNSQIYKVAGNSIAVCVVEELFKALLCPSILPTGVS